MQYQHDFAICQDTYAQKARQLRSEIAFQNIKEVNELIKTRKTLQIEAYRLSQRFKLQVNQMAQKEVEDIFVKTMKKEQFKSSNTIRLAKTFMANKKKERNFDKPIIKQATIQQDY